MSAEDPNVGADANTVSQTVISNDGTVIAYNVTGSGRPVIVIPGALSTAADYSALAGALGRSHTVYTMERRGRGLSGGQGHDYSMTKECEDVAALQHMSGSDFLFGHSYGGLIALEFARNNSSVSRIAVYEPGVSINGSIPIGWLPAFREYVAKQQLLDAFATLSIGAGPESARRMPRWIMKLLLPRFLKPAALERRLALLASTASEHEIIGQLDGSYANYSSISASVLLMHGGRSKAPYVAKANSALSSVLPRCVEEVFPKLDHFGPDETGPLEIAAALRAFFV